MAIFPNIPGLKVSLRQEGEDLRDMPYHQASTSDLIQSPQIIRKVKVVRPYCFKIAISVDETYQHQDFHLCGWVYVNGRRLQHVQLNLTPGHAPTVVVENRQPFTAIPTAEVSPTAPGKFQ
jgi:hypothetical protein